jgi:RNA polymerase sigma-70 factor (ECF subfamily)
MQRRQPDGTREDAEPLRAIRSVELDFPALFDDQYDEITAYLMRRRTNRADAEDIAQATFAEAYDHRSTYDPRKGTPRAWLFGIATHLLRRHFRSEGRELRAYGRAASREEGSQDGSDATCGRLDAHASAGALARALATLSSGDLEVLTLYFWAELSYDEIATALEIPKGTVGSRLNRARSQVRAQLDPRILEGNDG